MLYSGLPNDNRLPNDTGLPAPASTAASPPSPTARAKEGWGSPILGILLSALGSLSGLTNGGSARLPIPRAKFDIGPTGWKPYKPAVLDTPFMRAMAERTKDRPW